MRGTATAVDLGERNRRLAKVLLLIMAALAVASLLAGIRW